MGRRDNGPFDTSWIDQKARPSPAQGAMPPPAAPASARKRELINFLRWAGLVLVATVLVVAVLAFLEPYIGQGGGFPRETGSGSVPHTPAALDAGAMVLHLSGKGQKQSVTFAVGATWTIAYTCQKEPGGLDSMPLYVTVHNADGSRAYQDVTFSCTHDKASDTTAGHGSGSYYLAIDTADDVDWDVTVTNNG